MRAIFSPGPSYHDPRTREYAGWVHILDIYKEALEEAGYEVDIPPVELSDIDDRSTMGRTLSYDLWASRWIARHEMDWDLFLGPPGYSLMQMTLLKRMDPAITTYLYVWNNADWYRDQQLVPEYKAAGQYYDTSRTWRQTNLTALEEADYIIACSRFVADSHKKALLSHHEHKIRITPWGVDSERFVPPAERPPGLRVLFVGGDPIRKGLIYLYKAVHGLKIPGLELWIAGCNVTCEGLDCRTRMLGPVPAKEMPEVMRQCHIICIPTLEDGIALAIQEGMASGLVPITTLEAAEPFLNPPQINTGWHVSYRSSDDIRDTIQYLADNPELLTQCSQNARMLATMQPWSITKDNLVEIIRQTQKGRYE